MTELSSFAVSVKKDLDENNGRALVSNAKVAEQVYHELRGLYDELYWISEGSNKHFCTSKEALLSLEEGLKEKQKMLQRELDEVQIALEQVEISK